MTAIDLKTDHDLASLRYWTAKLRLVADIWDDPDLDPAERESVRPEWDNITDRIARIQAMADRGELRQAAMTELRAIADELSDLRPTMQRLRLRLPDLDALSRVAAQPAAAPPS
ncbi:MAG TPA: hypothetical protein VFH48_05225 [Chloroflexota bacterium]|nr:hypothetical protein [Chloroflexota bacterium]